MCFKKRRASACILRHARPQLQRVLEATHARAHGGGGGDVQAELSFRALVQHLARAGIVTFGADPLASTLAARHYRVDVLAECMGERLGKTFKTRKDEPGGGLLSVRMETPRSHLLYKDDTLCVLCVF